MKVLGLRNLFAAVLSLGVLAALPLTVGRLAGRCVGDDRSSGRSERG